VVKPTRISARANAPKQARGTTRPTGRQAKCEGMADPAPDSKALATRNAACIAMMADYRWSDNPADYWGYTDSPKNWLEEVGQLALFLDVTDGDDFEVPLDDGITPDGGAEWSRRRFD